MYNGFEIKDSMRNRRFYNGKSSKFGITVDGVDYLVKMPLKHDKLISPYTEYVASRAIRYMGVSCQEAWLGSYGAHRVTILRDFTQGTKGLHTFAAIGQSSVYTSLSGKEYSYDDVLHTLNSLRGISDQEKNEILAQFWRMFVCDAILANRDRHSENWGYLITKGDHYIPAPLYDNGSSLFPDVGKVIQRFKSDEFKFLCERSEKFPASLFLLKREDGISRRTNYHQIASHIDEIPGLLEVRSMFTFDSVFAAMSKTVSEVDDIIPEVFRRFYIMVACMRYLHSFDRLSLEESYTILRRKL